MADLENEVIVSIPITENTLDNIKHKNRSKLGGVPIWQNNSPLIQSYPSCKLCLKEMIFIGQIYAPTTMDRSLYFFCCLSSCASQSNGWLVLRDQSIVLKETNSNTTSSVVQTESNKSDRPKTNWGDIYDNNEDDDEEDLSDLLEIINSREKLQTTISLPNVPSKQQQQQQSSQPPSIPNSDNFNNDEDVQNLSGSLSNAPTLFGPIWMSDEYESNFSVSTKSSKLSHEQELLQKYLEELSSDKNIDEDKSILNILKSHQNSKISSQFNGKNDEDDEDDDEDNDSDEEEYQTMLKSRPQQTNNSNVKSNDKNKIESLFYKKLSVCPNQIIRYNYGGLPLWCHSKIPPISSITCPRCSGCHEPRVYEMQLMPTLLSFLPNTSNSNSSESNEEKKESITTTSSSQPNIPSIESLSNGVDFGVVTVWSCPNSCELSSEEVVIVQSSSESSR